MSPKPIGETASFPIFLVFGDIVVSIVSEAFEILGMFSDS